MVDLQTKEKFIELRAQGYSFGKIAQALGVSKQTLINWSNEFEVEIANLKAIELDALQEKYFISKKRRIELFGDKLQRIKGELDKRELKEIPTDKLFEIFLKLYSLLKQENTEITFQKRTPISDPLDLSSVMHWQA